MSDVFYFFCVLQKVSEKVGGAEGTKLDEDFTEMEKARLSSFYRPAFPSYKQSHFDSECM